jgi:hypothetical protein
MHYLNLIIPAGGDDTKFAGAFWKGYRTLFSLALVISLCFYIPYYFFSIQSLKNISALFCYLFITLWFLYMLVVATKLFIEPIIQKLPESIREKLDL